MGPPGLPWPLRPVCNGPDSLEMNSGLRLCLTRRFLLGWGSAALAAHNPRNR